MTIYLIGCGNKKRRVACPAKELYTGGIFVANRDIYEMKYMLKCPAFILSAKYGIVPFDKVISPYNVSIDDLTPKELQSWCKGVRQALQDLGVTKIIAAYPKRYGVFEEHLEGIKIARHVSQNMFDLFRLRKTLRGPTHMSVI